MRLSMARSYGTSVGAVERLCADVRAHARVGLWSADAGGSGICANAGCSATKPVKMVVLGDSLSAGLGLPASAAFPAQLQKALKAKG